MADGLATTGLQEMGTDVLSTGNTSMSQGLKCPIRGFRFLADFGSKLGTTSFKNVSGCFTTEMEVQEYREGGFGFLTKRKVPGLVSYQDVTLEKGLYMTPSMYVFFNDYLEGNNFDPVPEAYITVFDNAMKPVAKWTIINAWPKQYESGDLSAEDSSILIEKLVLVHEGIRRELTV